MTKKRGFEIVSKYASATPQVTLPRRATQQAAGYDLCAAVDFVVPSIWKKDLLGALELLKLRVTHGDLTAALANLKPVLVPTGVKAYMQPDEFLMLANRSSAPLKRFLVLPNGIGVIDADYYNNEANEGEIFVQLLNFGLTDYHIKQGERIAQGIFMPYLPADNDNAAGVRTGGFGSTGK